MASKSMTFVRRQLKKKPDLKITIHDFPNLWETGDYVKSIFKEKYNTIWTPKGMECELKETDTEKKKNVTIIYNPNVSYNLMEYNYFFGYANDSKNINNFSKNFVAIIEKVLWGGLDIGPMMPEHYDLDAEREAYQKIYDNTTNDMETPDSYFSKIHETYFDYDVKYTVGDFVCFKDCKESYKLEAEITGAIPDLDSNKDVVRYISMLPIKIEYIYNKNSNEEVIPETETPTKVEIATKAETPKDDN